MTPLLAIADRLSRELAALRFRAPVAFVYNPLDYAREAYAAYVERFAAGPKEAVFVGMNPGPFGMAQTGVPFGEVASVRDWLGIRARDRQARARASRSGPSPDSIAIAPKSAASDCGAGRAAASRTPDAFFARFFVANYCPLLFLEELRPQPAARQARERRATGDRRALRRSVARDGAQLAPRCVLGIGRFAERRAGIALAGMGVDVGFIPHPSPASPAANRGWEAQAEAAIAGCGVELDVPTV